VTSHQTPFTLKEVKLEVTYRCNLTCIHCSSEALPSCSREMPFDRAMDLLNQVLSLGVQKIVFSGGEPLLWVGLHDAVRRCSSDGVAPTIYTSGNVENPVGAVTSLKDSGCGALVFSLFASEQDGHERITRRRGSFETTLAAIDAARQTGLPVELHFVPMSVNYAELPDVLDLATRRGLERVSVLRFVPQGRGAIQPSMALTRAQNLELRRMIIEGRARIDVRAGSPYNFLLVNESPACYAATDRLTISPDFRIYPCDAFKQIEAHELVGSDEFSRLDRWSLEKCWLKSPYLAAVRDYLATPFGPPCDTCELLAKCLSGCLAHKVIAHGGLQKVPDPMCLKKKGV
jgi:radical SAM protein with 4Fe4S-binding SPASM domain